MFTVLICVSFLACIDRDYLWKSRLISFAKEVAVQSLRKLLVEWKKVRALDRYRNSLKGTEGPYFTCVRLCNAFFAHVVKKLDGGVVTRGLHCLRLLHASYLPHICTIENTNLRLLGSMKINVVERSSRKTL